MHFDHEQIIELILKYRRNERLSKEEEIMLESWRSQSEENRNLPDLLKNDEWVAQQLRDRPTVPSEELWKLVCEKTGIEYSSLNKDTYTWGDVAFNCILILIIVYVIVIIFLHIYNQYPAPFG